MSLKYGERKELKDYNLNPSNWDKVGLGLEVTKVEFWAHQYDFSFQFWGPGNNNVYINRDNVEVHSSGGFETVKEMMEYVVAWCKKANPRVKYPAAILGTEIDLP